MLGVSHVAASLLRDGSINQPITVPSVPPISAAGQSMLPGLLQVAASAAGSFDPDGVGVSGMRCRPDLPIKSNLSCTIFPCNDDTGRRPQIRFQVAPLFALTILRRHSAFSRRRTEAIAAQGDNTVLLCPERPSIRVSVEEQTAPMTTVRP
jgi:hypothetical protein